MKQDDKQDVVFKPKAKEITNELDIGDVLSETNSSVE